MTSKTTDHKYIVRKVVRMFACKKQATDFIEISGLPSLQIQKIIKKAIDMLVSKELVEVVNTKMKLSMHSIITKMSDPAPHNDIVPVFVLKRSEDFYERYAVHAQTKKAKKKKMVEEKIK